MGMFDYIKYEMDCPKCGTRVDGFQSKDGLCISYTLEYWEVDNFYASCPKCEAWIEFTRKTAREQVPISDYVMTVKNRQIKEME